MQMSIQSLPKYQDIRNAIRRSGRYPYVGTAGKDTIVIHHSLTAMHLKGSNPHAFANTHIDTNGWHGCAYPFVIMPDGTIYQTDDLDRRTYHAGNTNTRSIGICVVGDFRKGKEKPTQAQMESLYLTVKAVKKELPRINRVIGHQECPGYSWKNCPGDNWDYRRVISGELVTSDDGVAAPTPLPGKYTIQDGDTFWSIAKEISGMTVDKLVAANPGVDPTRLQVGQVINLAGAVNTPLPSAPVSGLGVGSTVTVKRSATHYDTGQPIADHVKGSRYKILQVKSVSKSFSKKSYLLSGIVSWVLEQDIEESGVDNGIGAPAPAKSTPAAVKKEYAYFPPGHGTWSVYPLNKQPVKANAVGAINPTKFGGLTYEVLGKPFANVVTIQTSSFGRVNIFVGDPNSKLIWK
jgi:LysM repeat protein